MTQALQVRQALGRYASPLGVPADLQSADKKRLDLFDADLQSASSENAASQIWRYEKPTAADCKSAGTPNGLASC